MTNARTLRGARFRSNSFSKKCRCSQRQAIQANDVLISVAYSAVTAFVSIVWIPQALTKVVSPCFWKRSQFGSATQKLLVRGICSVQTDNIRHGDAVLGSGVQFYRVTSCDFPFYYNGQVEPS